MSLFGLAVQIVKYPTRDEVSSDQGVGPHFDAGFLTFVSPPSTFKTNIYIYLRNRRTARARLVYCILYCDGWRCDKLLQASDHAGLQVQNVSGEWIDVPPRPYTFVINIGKGPFKRFTSSLHFLPSPFLLLSSMPYE